jgi:glycerol kinase
MERARVAHLVRATLDAIVFRVRDLLEDAWAADQLPRVALWAGGRLSSTLSMCAV